MHQQISKSVKAINSTDSKAALGIFQSNTCLFYFQYPISPLSFFLFLLSFILHFFSFHLFSGQCSHLFPFFFSSNSFNIFWLL